MTTLDLWADNVLADPLAQARAAGNAIGYVGFDLPQDLLAAIGRPASHLPWSADAATPLADQWVESSFAPWARSILDQWARGAFDGIDQVVFSRGDDSAQRLYYYTSELQRRGKIGGPTPLILDIARVERATSVARTIDTLRRLADALSIDEAALRQGIARTNRQRLILERLDRERVGSGVPYERIARASLFAPVPDLAAPSGAKGGRPLLLAGTAPPDDRLHRMAEAAGWTVAGEAHERGLLRLGTPIEPGDDPFVAVGERVHGARFGPRSFADPAAELLAEARRVGAEAVVLWLIEQEESIVWHAPSQRAALEQAGVPLLVLTRRAWDAADGVETAIAAWLTEQSR